MGRQNDLVVQLGRQETANQVKSFIGGVFELSAADAQHGWINVSLGQGLLFRSRQMCRRFLQLVISAVLVFEDLEPSCNRLEIHSWNSGAEFCGQASIETSNAGDR